MPTSSQNRNIPVLEPTARIWLLIVAVASIFFLTPRLYEQQTLAQTQASCDTSSCPQITNGVGSDLKLSGPITYSFDEATLSLLGDAATIADFKKTFAAAAKDWQDKTGVSITEAPAGSAGNLTIRVANDPTTRDNNSDPFPGLLKVSDLYGGWSAAGKDRLFSHELGHFLGLGDVRPQDCPGTETIMRQLGKDDPNNNVYANMQIRGGYNCNGRTPCPDDQKLPLPPRPNPCDAAKAKANHDHNPADDEGGGGGGGDPCYGSDTSCEPYYDPTEYIYYDDYDVPDGYITFYITEYSVDVYECDECGDLYGDPGADGGCYYYSSYGSCM